MVLASLVPGDPPQPPLCKGGGAWEGVNRRSSPPCKGGGRGGGIQGSTDVRDPIVCGSAPTAAPSAASALRWSSRPPASTRSTPSSPAAANARTKNGTFFR